MAKVYTYLRRHKPHAVYMDYYSEWKKRGSPCEMCNSIEGTRIVHDGKLMKIVGANFPYDFWDTAHVTEHLMLMPKSHTGSIADLTPAEAKEYLELLAEYEEKGYSIYSRGVASTQRTIPHLHTHLLMLGKVQKILFYISRPHIVLSR